MSYDWLRQTMVCLRHNYMKVLLKLFQKLGGSRRFQSSLFVPREFVTLNHDGKDCTCLPCRAVGGWRLRALPGGLRRFQIWLFVPTFCLRNESWYKIAIFRSTNNEYWVRALPADYWVQALPAANVAAITALMVCMRFSASSKTIDCADSNTSSVTSMQSIPKRS